MTRLTQFKLHHLQLQNSTTVAGATHCYNYWAPVCQWQFGLTFWLAKVRHLWSKQLNERHVLKVLRGQLFFLAIIKQELWPKSSHKFWKCELGHFQTGIVSFMSKSSLLHSYFELFQMGIKTKLMYKSYVWCQLNILIAIYKTYFTDCLAQWLFVPHIRFLLSGWHKNHECIDSNNFCVTSVCPWTRIPSIPPVSEELSQFPDPWKLVH